MADYALTIEIHSIDRELLEELAIALESISRNLQMIAHVDVMRSDGAPLESYFAAQFRYQTVIMERWIAGVDDQDY